MLVLEISSVDLVDGHGEILETFRYDELPALVELPKEFTCFGGFSVTVKSKIFHEDVRGRFRINTELPLYTLNVIAPTGKVQRLLNNQSIKMVLSYTEKTQKEYNDVIRNRQLVRRDAQLQSPHFRFR